jgi:hypothetical protein
MSWLQVRLLLLALLGLCFLACGGGGGGGGGGGIQVDLQPSSATVGRNGQVNFVATVQNSADQNVSWTASAGSIAPTGPNTATYTAPNSAATATVTATSVADPTRADSSTVNVVAGVATVTGRVVQQNSSFGIGGIVVEFRDSSGATVATATTNSSGNFSAAVPTSAVRFHLRNSSIPFSYYKQFTYNSLRYATTISTCSAPLPSLSEGGNFPLATTIALPPSSGPPPPPPNGC